MSTTLFIVSGQNGGIFSFSSALSFELHSVYNRNSRNWTYIWRPNSKYDSKTTPDIIEQGN